MEELNFFPLNVPSNIYGFAHLKGDRSRFLVSTLEKQIFCIEYSENQFTCTEVHFTYIPNGAEIISIDAFRRKTTCDIVVGITFFKNSKESDSNELRKNVSQSSNRSLSNSERNPPSNHYYFNVYSSFSVGRDANRFDLNQVAQDCQTFELEFVPFQLYHTSLMSTDQTSENVWLLCGSDCCVHIYREDLKKQCFYKEKIDLFPELTNFTSIALWIDVMQLEQKEGRYRRLSAIGCEDGSVKLSLVEYEEVTRPQVVHFFKHQFDGPILSVRLFRDIQVSSLLERSLKRRLRLPDLQDESDIHLLVANSYEEPVVYRNVMQHGITRRKVLPTQNRMDLLLATFIADFNFDGENEILIGKYSKELTTYRYNPKTEAYAICNQIKFANPIQVIAYLDITGNGIKELVIITTKGVVIQRHKFSEVAKILQDKVALCLELIE